MCSKKLEKCLNYGILKVQRYQVLSEKIRLLQAVPIKRIYLRLVLKIIHHVRIS